jgi:uncharacterized protein (DUF2141 family)
MKYLIVLILISILGLFPLVQKHISGKGTLIVKIVGLRNNDGRMKIFLFNSEEGFPNYPKKALKIIDVYNLENNRCKTSFKNIEFGEYAVSSLHDENKNNEMDTGFLGIPTEGYGASNDARGFFGPPKYKDAKFFFSKDTLNIEMRMIY